MGTENLIKTPPEDGAFFYGFLSLQDTTVIKGIGRCDHHRYREI